MGGLDGGGGGVVVQKLEPGSLRETQGTMLKTLGLTLAMLSLASGAYVVKRYEFTRTAPAPNTNYVEGSTEHHCILFKDDVPVSVVGTYGMMLKSKRRYGYFEGSFKKGDTKALINWWETATTSDNLLKPTVGSGWIAYNSTFANYDGGVGASAVTASYGTFVTISGSSGSLKIDSNAAGADASFSTNCLLARSSNTVGWESRMGTFLPDTTANYFSAGGTVDERKKMQALASTYWKSEQGANFICINGMNIDAKYQYTYSAAEADGTIKAGDQERGVYGKDSIALKAAAGDAMVGTWTALSGPVSGSTGTNLYMVQPGSGGAQLLGFYCNVDTKNVRKACYSELYSYTDVYQCSGAATSHPAFLGSIVLAVVALVMARRQRGAMLVRRRRMQDFEHTTMRERVKNFFLMRIARHQ
eukprot:746430-Hanusia_phi.AAC.1